MPLSLQTISSIFGLAGSDRISRLRLLRTLEEVALPALQSVALLVEEVEAVVAGHLHAAEVMGLQLRAHFLGNLEVGHPRLEGAPQVEIAERSLDPVALQQRLAQLVDCVGHGFVADRGVTAAVEQVRPAQRLAFLEQRTDFFPRQAGQGQQVQARLAASALVVIQGERAGIDVDVAGRCLQQLLAALTAEQQRQSDQPP